MKKREFIKTSSVLTIGALTMPLNACHGGSDQNSSTEANGVFELPSLPYGFEALEPMIDKMTMEIHHGKHHAGYVSKLNAALEGSKMSKKSLEEIVSSVTEEDTALRNNGGGHYNHSLFWKIMKPGGGDQPTGRLLDAMSEAFGSAGAFSEAFTKAAAQRFGSGWAWLSVDKDKKLFVSSTPNQDNPLMANLVENSGTPILGLDVWEHAYYLRYQNRRTEYIDNFMQIVNWEEVAKNYDALI